MAWDQCKDEACAQIEKRKDSLGEVKKALEELSRESDIPISTLKRWYYEIKNKPRLKNDPRETSKNPPTIDGLWKSVGRKLRNVNKQILELHQFKTSGEVTLGTYSEVVNEFNRLSEHVLTFSDATRPKFVDEGD